MAIPSKTRPNLGRREDASSGHTAPNSSPSRLNGVSVSSAVTFIFPVVVLALLALYFKVHADPSRFYELTQAATLPFLSWTVSVAGVWLLAVATITLFAPLLDALFPRPKAWAAITSTVLCVAILGAAAIVGATVTPSQEELVQSWVDERYGIHVTEEQAGELVEEKTVTTSDGVPVRLQEKDEGRSILTNAAETEGAELPCQITAEENAAHMQKVLDDMPDRSGMGMYRFVADGTTGCR